MRRPWLLATAEVRCAHETGVVAMKTSQTLVTVMGQPIVVEADPVGCAIAGCNNVNVFTGLLPCLLTLTVERGYSDLVRVQGCRAVRLDLVGKTSGTPVQTQDYSSRRPGQDLVAEASA